MSQATGAAAKPASSAPVHITPLTDADVKLLGQDVNVDAVITLADAAQVDLFFERPLEFLKNSGAMINSDQELHILTDGRTVRTKAYCGLVGKSGHHIYSIEVWEVDGARMYLRPEVAGGAALIEGIHVKDLGPRLRWGVTSVKKNKDGVLEEHNLRTGCHTKSEAERFATNWRSNAAQHR